jgi:dihydropteroate synthase
MAAASDENGWMPFRLRCRDRYLDLEPGNPRIMGILNLTPDSFSDGGRYEAPEQALSHALSMIAQGADIVDVGGETTRPGSNPVPEAKQIDRVCPVIESIRKRSDVFISVDTTRSAVAAAAIAAGADIVNDTSALADDEEMAEVVSRSGAAIVLMHRQGIPATMQQAPHYDAFFPELLTGLRRRIALAEGKGILADQIVIDPGVGFGKRFEDNLEIHRSLHLLHSLSKPILFASSRKSFLGVVSGGPPADRLAASIASNVIAAWQGAHMVRVHDVSATREAVALVAAVRKGSAC